LPWPGQYDRRRFCESLPKGGQGKGALNKHTGNRISNVQLPVNIVPSSMVKERSTIGAD